ncbi:cytochrome P450 [Klebsiella michiganensis]|uniref:cytochrome P450 n=1 Tax=Klebsiella michiganensis TaxID=1134687 RepID=UPI0032DA4D8A
MKVNDLKILSDEYKLNPYLYIENLDRSKRVIVDSTLGTKVVICYKTAKEILSKNDIFSTEPLAARAEPVMRGKVLAQMHGDEHKLKRSMITRKITGGMLREHYSEHLKYLCDQTIEKIRSKDKFDFIVDFGKEFSMLSTFKILGIDDRYVDFYYDRLRLIVKFATGFNLSDSEAEVYINAAIEMESAIIELIEDKKINPGGDLVLFILAEGENDPNKKLSSSEIVALTLNVLLAASEPVDKVLSICIFHLLRDKHLLKGIISGGIKSNDILQETLRITPPVHLIPRLAVEDYTTESGDKINNGDVVFILLPAVNRDSEYFENPDIFNPTRTFKGHASYGSGIHTCIGAQFANLQLNLALERLAPLLLEYEEVEPPVFSGICCFFCDVT